MIRTFLHSRPDSWPYFSRLVHTTKKLLSAARHAGVISPVIRGGSRRTPSPLHACYMLVSPAARATIPGSCCEKRYATLLCGKSGVIRAPFEGGSGKEHTGTPSRRRKRG